MYPLESLFIIIQRYKADSFASAPKCWLRLLRACCRSFRVDFGTIHSPCSAVSLHTT
jgi:hypothetical protein